MRSGLKMILGTPSKVCLAQGFGSALGSSGMDASRVTSCLVYSQARTANTVRQSQGIPKTF